MATRLNKRQTESAKAAIQTSRIIAELHRCVFGEREMTVQQIQSARILLDKSIGNAPQEQVVDGELTIRWKS